MNLSSAERAELGAQRCRWRRRIQESMDRYGIHSCTSLAREMGLNPETVRRTLTGTLHSPRVLDKLREIGVPEQYRLADSPECVAQAVVTRLRLLAGEWFVDLQEGIPLPTHVLGKHTPQTYDPIIRARILKTEGVAALVRYESLFDTETRRLTVNATLRTVYGTATLHEVFP